jgi:hypothetical protein
MLLWIILGILLIFCIVLLHSFMKSFGELIAINKVLKDSNKSDLDKVNKIKSL